MCTFLAQFDWVCIYLKCTFWWVLTNIYRTTIKIETISSPLQVLIPFVGSHLCSPSVGQPLTCFLSLQDCFTRIKVFTSMPIYVMCFLMYVFLCLSKCFWDSFQLLKPSNLFLFSRWAGCLLFILSDRHNLTHVINHRDVVRGVQVIWISLKYIMSKDKWVIVTSRENCK